MLLAVLPGLVAPEPAAWPGLRLYRLRALTETMSKLSLSSPVSALKPRYATGGTLKLGISKHVVYSSSDLYCSSSFRNESWK